MVLPICGYQPVATMMNHYEPLAIIVVTSNCWLIAGDGLEEEYDDQLLHHQHGNHQQLAIQPLNQQHAGIT